jgi:hypothetical protein
MREAEAAREDNSGGGFAAPRPSYDVDLPLHHTSGSAAEDCIAGLGQLHVVVRNRVCSQYFSNCDRLPYSSLANFFGNQGMELEKNCRGRRRLDHH